MFFRYVNIICVVALLSLIGCPSNGRRLSPVDVPVGGSGVFVVQGEYIIEAEGPWCAYPRQEEYCHGNPPGMFALSESGGFRLLTKEGLVLKSKKIVPYNPKEDLCREITGPCSPNYVVTSSEVPNDPLLDSLWGLGNIRARKAWKRVSSGSGVKVAVIDSGVDCNHPDIKCVDEFNAITGERRQTDDNGHGTHVAGTICAIADNGIGIAGVAWGCDVVAIKFLSSGGGTIYNAIKSIQYAVASGAKIINASWGGGGYSQPLYNAIKRAEAAGVLFVAAAGNSGVNNDRYKHYPSSYNLENIVAVASLDGDSQISSFSNYGESDVDIAAPGRGIVSLEANTAGYRSLSGTSMAAPHVSGAAVLVLKRIPGARARTVRERLLNSGVVDQSLPVSSRTRLNLHRLVQGKKKCHRCCRRRKIFRRCKLKCSSRFPDKPRRREGCNTRCRQRNCF